MPRADVRIIQLAKLTGLPVRTLHAIQTVESKGRDDAIFARYYNGPGQQEACGNKIAAAWNAASDLA